MKCLFLLLAVFLTTQLSYGFQSREAVTAEINKKNVYLSNSIFSGGDPLANPISLNSVRWAANPNGFERLVIDISGEGSGWENKIPPYFQVGHDSKTGTISVSLRNVARRIVTNESLKQSVEKSKFITSAYLAPAIEGDLAAMEFGTNAPVNIESFLLVNPPRIVIDVRSSK